MKMIKALFKPRIIPIVIDDYETAFRVKALDTETYIHNPSRQSNIWDLNEIRTILDQEQNQKFRHGINYFTVPANRLFKKDLTAV